jgi:hypothetical protein
VTPIQTRAHSRSKSVFCICIGITDSDHVDINLHAHSSGGSPANGPKLAFFPFLCDIWWLNSFWFASTSQCWWYFAWGCTWSHQVSVDFLQEAVRHALNTFSTLLPVAVPGDPFLLTPAESTLGKSSIVSFKQLSRCLMLTTRAPTLDQVSIIWHFDWWERSQVSDLSLWVKCSKF